MKFRRLSRYAMLLVLVLLGYGLVDVAATVRNRDFCADAGILCSTTENGGCPTLYIQSSGGPSTCRVRTCELDGMVFNPDGSTTCEYTCGVWQYCQST